MLLMGKLTISTGPCPIVMWIPRDEWWRSGVYFLWWMLQIYVSLLEGATCLLQIAASNLPLRALITCWHPATSNCSLLFAPTAQIAAFAPNSGSITCRFARFGRLFVGWFFGHWHIAYTSRFSMDFPMDFPSISDSHRKFPCTNVPKTH